MWLCINAMASDYNLALLKQKIALFEPVLTLLGLSTFSRLNHYSWWIGVHIIVIRIHILVAQPHILSESSEVGIWSIENLGLFQSVCYMGERQLPAILQSMWTGSVLGDSRSEAPVQFTEPERAGDILAFQSLGASIPLRQYQEKSGYQLAQSLHSRFSYTGLPSSNGQLTQSWHFKAFGSGGHIPNKHKFIYYQSPSRKSYLHLNVKFINRSQSRCTASSESNSMYTWWE